MYIIEDVEELEKVDLFKRVNDVFTHGFEAGEVVYEDNEESRVEMYHQNGLDYQFKIISGLAKRPTNRKSEDKEANKKANPFLKNEPELTVCDDFLHTYKLLLNKFPNTRNHFLMVTKDFVKQDTLLSGTDLWAIYKVIQKMNANDDQEFFSFFNSGQQSGYSQIHKHIQYHPLPSFVESSQTHHFKPFAHSYAAKFPYSEGQRPLTDPRVEFKHFILPLPEAKDKVVTEKLLESLYQSLMSQVVQFFESKNLLKEGSGLLVDEELNPDISYNFVMTSKYLLVVPRLRANYNNLWANSLQFLGLFSGRSQEVKDNILELGFQAFLSKVGFPNDEVESSEDKTTKL